MNRKFNFIFMVTLALVVFQSCDIVKELFEKKEQKGVNVICLVDFSGSIPPATLSSYKEVILQNVFKNLLANDKILILPIDYASQTSSTEIFSSEMNPKIDKKLISMQDKEKFEKRMFDKYKDSLSKIADSLIDNSIENRVKYSGGTDITGALKETKKYLNENEINIIVIFSDMIQETDKLNLLSLKTETNIEPLLEKSEKISLENSDIFVFTGDQPDLSQKLFENTKLFWQKYFDKCGITLIDYSSGAKTHLTEKLKSYHKKN